MGKKNKKKKSYYTSWRTKETSSRVKDLNRKCSEKENLAIQKKVHNFELELDKIIGDSHMKIVCRYPDWKEINIGNDSDSSSEVVRIMRMRCKDEFPNGSLYFNARYTNFVEWLMGFIWTGQDSIGFSRSSWGFTKLVFKATVLITVVIIAIVIVN